MIYGFEVREVNGRFYLAIGYEDEADIRGLIYMDQIAFGWDEETSHRNAEGAQISPIKTQTVYYQPK